MRSKFLKKSLAVLVAATMAFSALPMFAGAAGEATPGDLAADKVAVKLSPDVEITESAENQAKHKNNQNAIEVSQSGNSVTITKKAELQSYTGGGGEGKWYGIMLTFAGDIDTKDIVGKVKEGTYGVEQVDVDDVARYGGTTGKSVILWFTEEKTPNVLTFVAADGTEYKVNFKFVDGTKTEDPTDPVDPVDPSKPSVEPTKPATPVKVAPNAPITVAPVIKGINPDVAASLTLNVTEAKKDEGAGKTAFEAAAANGAVLGFYEIKLTNPDGSPYVLKAGETLEMTFELGKEYANQKLVIRHFNSETGKHVKDYEVTADENGKVTIEVTELSFFAVQKAAAKSTNPKTGDSTQIFVLLSVLAVAGASVVVLRKRQLAK